MDNTSDALSLLSTYERMYYYEANQADWNMWIMVGRMEASRRLLKKQTVLLAGRYKWYIDYYSEGELYIFLSSSHMKQWLMSLSTIYIEVSLWKR